MVTESRARNCSKCDVELVNSTGVHMGIPFGKWGYYDGMNHFHKTDKLYCAKCYDEITIDLDHKTAKEAK